MIKKTTTEIAKTIIETKISLIVVTIEDEMKIADRETTIAIDLDTAIILIDEILGEMIEIEGMIEAIEIVIMIDQEMIDTKTSQRNHVTVHQIRPSPAEKNYIDYNYYN